MSSGETRDWSVQGIWNDVLAKERRPPKVRDYIGASDIGKSYYDRYQKMRGVAPDRVLEPRLLRKFAAGNFFEDMVGLILSKVGVVRSAQRDVEIPECAQHLRVIGKIDFEVGGGNWDEAREAVLGAGFPDFARDVGLALIAEFEQKFPNGLPPKLVEVKSVNSQVFWAKKDYIEEAYPHHVMQLYTYMKATGIREGVVLYVSKDDLTVEERPVILGTERYEEAWLKDVTEMSRYIREGVEPPKPDYIVWDKRSKLRFQHEKEKCVVQGCWVPNWQVGWSDYLTTMTGLESEEAWEESLKPELKTRNEKLKDDYKAKLLAAKAV